MAKVLYTSPLFHQTNGKNRQFLIDAEGVKYHRKRDTAVMMIESLGGLNAPWTEEVRKYHRQILSANRAIKRGGYYATFVPQGD